MGISKEDKKKGAEELFETVMTEFSKITIR